MSCVASYFIILLCLIPDYFTLSNARQFYLSRGEPIYFTCQGRVLALMCYRSVVLNDLLSRRVYLLSYVIYKPLYKGNLDQLKSTLYE